MSEDRLSKVREALASLRSLTVTAGSSLADAILTLELVEATLVEAKSLGSILGRVVANLGAIPPHNTPAKVKTACMLLNEALDEIDNGLTKAPGTAENSGGAIPSEVAPAQEVAVSHEEADAQVETPKPEVPPVEVTPVTPEGSQVGIL